MFLIYRRHKKNDSIGVNLLMFIISHSEAGKVSQTPQGLHFAIRSTILNSMLQKILTGQVQQGSVYALVAFILTVSPTLKS